MHRMIFKVRPIPSVIASLFAVLSQSVLKMRGLEKSRNGNAKNGKSAVNLGRQLGLTTLPCYTNRISKPLFPEKLSVAYLNSLNSFRKCD